MNRKLDIRSAGVDPDLAHDRDRGVAHHLIFLVGEGLRRGDGDGISGVNPHRIEILDRTHDHDVVVAVAHHLEFELLPAEDALLDQAFASGRLFECPGNQAIEFFLGKGNTAPGSTQGETGPDDGRQGGALDDPLGFFQGAGVAGHGYGQTDLAHRGGEAFAIFGLEDRFQVRPDQLDPVLLEHAAFGELDRDVEGRLSTDGREECIGFFGDDDAFDGIGGHRLDVGPIGDLGIGHDRGGVRVHEHHPVALFAQRATGLGPGVVELAGLADHDGPGADHENRVDVRSLRHQETPAISGCWNITKLPRSRRR